LREKLSESFKIELPEKSMRLVSSDKMAVKYALKLKDGNFVETVKIFDDKDLDKYTVCVSTQLGCPIKCSFCQTGLMGFVRNLDAAEIIGQVLIAAFDEKDSRSGLSNVVYMGMGEPLLNYENVLKSIMILNEPKGLNISMRKLTISTAGVIPEILKLMRESLPVTLAVSLHAPDDELRSKLVPLNKKYNVSEIIKAVKAYANNTGRRVTIEYVLINGVNDGKTNARKLAGLLKGLLCHVNLIAVNRSESGYLPPAKNKISEFKNILTGEGINATVRGSRGADIDAACGMLYKKINMKHMDAHDTDRSGEKQQKEL